MTYLPPGFEMQAEFVRHNQALLDIMGEEVVWTPSGGTAVPVRVIRADPSALAAAGVLLTLFGAVGVSGFTQPPAKNDTFVVDTVTYRLFDAQGPDEAGGIYLHLTK